MGIKLYNDDCLNVLNDIENNSIDLVVTDPPYEVITGGRNGGVKGKPSGILTENKQLMKSIPKADLWLSECFRVMKDGTHIYIMTNTLNLTNYLNIINDVGFKLHNLLVWNKNNTSPNRWYMKNCEYVIFARKGFAKSINNPSSQTVHNFDNIIGNKQHPTEKPVDLMKLYVGNSSQVGDTVFDPFMGVGSTGVACKELGRNFIGVELDKQYFDIATKRIC
jgi:site-specific DNA-methyltransferase (adenine-specific)